MNADKMPEGFVGMTKVDIETRITRLKTDRDMELKVILDRYGKKIDFYSKALQLKNKLENKKKPKQRTQKKPKNKWSNLQLNINLNEDYEKFAKELETKQI